MNRNFFNSKNLKVFDDAAPATATQAAPATATQAESDKILAMIEGYEQVATIGNLPRIEEATARLEQLGFIRPAQANVLDILRTAQLMAWGALNMSIVPYYYGNGTEMLAKNLANVASKRKMQLEAFKALVPACYGAILFLDIPLFKQDVVQLLVDHICKSGLSTLAERAEQLKASKKEVDDAKMMALDAILKERV